MSLFTKLIEKVVNEVNYNGVLRKQRSITSLFPTFYKRVRKVKDAGRVTLIAQHPDVWKFSAASAGGEGKYNLYVRFKNIEEQLKKFVPNVKLWNTEKTDVDYNKLGPEVMNKVDLELDCDCPADLYWGSEYIKTQRGAQFGRQEQRPPRIRNPRQYGMVCKHQQALLDKFPSYNFTFNGFLKQFYADKVKIIFDAAVKTVGAFKTAADELGKKAVEEPKKRPTRFGRGGRTIEEEPIEDEEENKDEL